MFDITPAALGSLVLWYPVLLFSLTVHEAAHAWAAKLGGDPTAYEAGQVTLNPMPHIKREFVGTVIVPLVSFLLSGWMIGWASAPFDWRWAGRYPKRAAWMSLAGPGANFALALIAGAVIRVGLWVGVFSAPTSLGFERIVAGQGLWDGVAVAMSIAFSLNVLLFVFNLLPAPPLDGSGALPLILPDRWIGRWQRLTRDPSVMFIGIFIAWSMAGRVFRPAWAGMLRLIYPELS